jgi:PAS domain S-box-containing protein
VAFSLTDLADLEVSSDDFLAAVLETAAQPMWVVSADGVIRFANPAAVSALGYTSAAELRGRRSDETMQSPVAAGEAVTRELDWFTRRDGSMVPVSFVSVPLDMPGGRGALISFTDIEERLRVERVIQDRDAVLTTQQASLRRLATLVAGGAASGEVFAAIAREVAGVLGVPMVQMWRFDPDGLATVVGAWNERPNRFVPGTRWPIDRGTVGRQVRQTGRPARIDDLATISGTVPEGAVKAGMSSIAGAPIVVGGAIWGVMVAAQFDGAPLPGRLEDRLGEFTDLVATAISSTASRQELARLADEQAALRRVATLVARGVPAQDVFAAVAREIGLLLGVDVVTLDRYDAEGTATGMAGWSRAGFHPPVGARAPVTGDNLPALVFRSSLPARMDSYDEAAGPLADRARELGIRCSAGAPVFADQRLWGLIVASSLGEAPLPLDTESRVAAFTELVGTAISNADAREERSRLSDEQAALRRVATLVAREVPAEELFGAVTDELCRLLGADLAALIRYDSDDTLSAVAASALEGEHPEVRGAWPLGKTDLSATIKHTGRSARVDESADVSGPVSARMREQLGIRSSVGSPVVMAGRVWGAVVVHTTRAASLPGDTESRLERFAELVATAMANMQARQEVHRLADEQASLRRVATLVARECPPVEVFAAVAEEVGRLLGGEYTELHRHETDGTATAVAAWGAPEATSPVRTRMALDGDDERAAVSAPIVVAGREWGAIRVLASGPTPLPADTESRIGEFAKLVAAAIRNVEVRGHLAASRARIVAAADGERRRVVRDLHDGAQQRLVHTVITLKLAVRALDRSEATAPQLVGEALEQAHRANVELRDLAHGILPGVLTRGGLRAGVSELASRMSIPVSVDVGVDRLPPAVEATAYFVVAEALTNVTKHSGAGHAAIRARVDGPSLLVAVDDDGSGGARADGSGLLGLEDRLAVLEGRLRIHSPPEGGTVVEATIPLA